MYRSAWAEQQKQVLMGKTENRFSEPWQHVGWRDSSPGLPFGACCSLWMIRQAGPLPGHWRREMYGCWVTVQVGNGSVSYENVRNSLFYRGLRI